MSFIQIAVEGRLDTEVAQRIVRVCGAEPQDPPIIARGRTVLLNRLRSYVAAANNAPWFVLCDLDYDECAPSLIERRVLTRVGTIPSQLRFSVAVRTVEAWLLADSALANFLGVDTRLLPREPENESRPKDEVVKLALRSSMPEIRKGIGGDRDVIGPGPDYNDLLIQFVKSDWSPERAARRSDSLRRAMEAVGRLAGG